MDLIIKELSKYIVSGSHNYEQLFTTFDTHKEAHSFMADIYFDEVEERYRGDAESIELDLDIGLLSFGDNYAYISNSDGYQVDLEINRVDFILLGNDNINLKKYAVAGTCDGYSYLEIFDNYESAYNVMMSIFNRVIDENYGDDEEALQNDIDFKDILQGSDYAYIIDRGYGEFQLSIHEVCYNINS